MAKFRAAATVADGQAWRRREKIAKPPVFAPGWYYRGADFLAILAIPLTGSLLRQTTENLTRNLCFWTLLAVLAVLLIESHGGYRPGPLPGQVQPARLAIYCFLATSFAMLAAAVLLGHPHVLTRRWTEGDLILTPWLIGAARGVAGGRLAALRGAGEVPGPLVICHQDDPPDLAAALPRHQLPGRIAGVFRLAAAPGTAASGNWPEIPDAAALLAAVAERHIQDVIFIHHPALDRFADAAHQALLSDLLAYPVRIWLAFDLHPNLPCLFGEDAYKIVPLAAGELVNSHNLTKRVFDLVLGAALLALTAPVLMVTACLVRASGPGPVIFRQTRTGAQGRQFTVLKFRTMAYEPAQPFAQARPGDPRITKIGRFLRQTSLDELLQLVNVIKGDMSLVGPRPHAPETEVGGITFENAVQLYRLRHRVKPGITGLAQIRGERGATPELQMLERRLASDLEYIRSWSPWLDLSILLRTLKVVFARTNAC